MACNASGDKPLLESTCFWSRRLFALLILLQLFRIIELAWACSSAGRAPALQVSRLNHISAASGVAYAEPRGATTLSNWTDVGPKTLPQVFEATPLCMPCLIVGVSRFLMVPPCSTHSGVCPFSSVLDRACP